MKRCALCNKEFDVTAEGRVCFACDEAACSDCSTEAQCEFGRCEDHLQAGIEKHIDRLRSHDKQQIEDLRREAKYYLDRVMRHENVIAAQEAVLGQLRAELRTMRLTALGLTLGAKDERPAA